MAQNKSNIAARVLSQGLQSWGQTVDEQIKAWQDAYDFMGLSVKLGTDGCFFTLEGNDIVAAKMFMADVREQFPLGKFEAEQAMIKEAREKYKKN